MLEKAWNSVVVLGFEIGSIDGVKDDNIVV